MMADNPNQIDISLSLLGADSPVVLNDLTRTLKTISETLAGLSPTTASGQYMLPGFEPPLATADGSGASRPQIAQSPMDQGGLPSVAPDSSPSPTESYYKRKTAEWRAGRPRSSTEPDDTGQYQFEQLSDVEQAAGMFNQIGDFVKRPFVAPAREISGFLGSMSDPAAMLGATWGGVTSVAGKLWNGIRGVNPESDANPSVFGQAKNIGINLAGAPWVLQNMMKVLPTTLPMLGDPRALNQIGGETGRDTFGTQIGPFTLPYTSEASRFGVNQVTQSFWEGLTTPGLSGKDILNIRKNLSSLGWGGQDKVGDLDRMSNVLKQIQQHQKGLDIGTTAAMMDKSMRWGGHSLDEFKKTILSLQPAARAAKMDLGEFQKAVSDAGGAAVQAGADYLTGVKNATQFSQMSGLPPQLYGQFIQSPWVQANLMGTTGALPWEQGMLSPDTTLMSGMNVANMLTDTFMNARSHGLTYRDASGRKQHLSSFQLGTAGAANVLGMSPQELRKLERNRQLLPQRARAYDDLQNYAKDARGGNETSAWMKLQNEILRGHYHGKDDVNMGSWMRQKLTNIYNSTKGHPQQRAEETRKLLEKTMRNAPSTTKSGVSISLAGDAARYFRLNTDKLKAKRAVNAGSASTTNSQGMPGNPSPIPFDPHRYAADPYNPQTGTGYAPDGSVPTSP